MPAEALPDDLPGGPITLTDEAGQPLGDARVVTISVTDAGARRVYCVGERPPQED